MFLYIFIEVFAALGIIVSEHESTIEQSPLHFAEYTQNTENTSYITGGACLTQTLKICENLSRLSKNPDYPN